MLVRPSLIAEASSASPTPSPRRTRIAFGHSGDAGAGLLGRPPPLQHDHVVPVRAQRERGGEAADAPAHHDDPPARSHAGSVPHGRTRHIRARP